MNAELARPCIGGCGTTTTGTQMRCDGCRLAQKKAERRRHYLANIEKYRASAQRWKNKNRKRHRAANRKYKKDHPDKQMIYWRRYREACNARCYDWARRNKSRVRAYQKRSRAVAAEIRKIGSSPREVMRYIEALVPRNLSSDLFRDVCQEIWLAMSEGTVTLKQIVAGKVTARTFIAAARGTHLEGRGYAVSLDVPMRDGRSWYDVLAAEPTSTIQSGSLGS